MSLMMVLFWGAVWLTVWLVPGVAGPHRRSASTRLVARRSPWPSGSPRDAIDEEQFDAGGNLRAPLRDAGNGAGHPVVTRVRLGGWRCGKWLPNASLCEVDGRRWDEAERAAVEHHASRPGLGGGTRSPVRGGPSLLGSGRQNARTAVDPTLCHSLAGPQTGGGHRRS
jgi:hypothetical protein